MKGVGTKIKICGLSRECDIDCVNEAMPDYAGFVMCFPKSRRNITPGRASQLRGLLSPDIKAVGVFVDRSIDTVARAANTAALDIIQLHGSEDDGYIAAVRELTGLPVWKAFKIRGAADIEAARKSTADMVLLDNGYGTGEAFDWTAAADIRRRFILAGGLTPENIHDAIQLLRPEVVDISSGVETGGFKDREKIKAAVKAAHGTKPTV